MKSKNALCGLSIAVVLQLGVLAGSAQTNIYLFSGSKTNIALNPGKFGAHLFPRLPSLLTLAQMHLSTEIPHTHPYENTKHTNLGL
jgi:hypothetical protein